MTEHVHEWIIDGAGIVICRPGGHVAHIMEWDEVLRRLNATERLSADAAKAIVQDYNSGYTLRIASTHYLKSYAAALEDRDD